MFQVADEGRQCFADARPVAFGAFPKSADADQNVDFVGAQGRGVERHALTHARLVPRLPLTMTRALGVLA